MFPICENLSEVAVASIVPKADSIPQEFKDKSTIWSQLVHEWLFSGLQGLKMTNKPGVDPNKAWQHAVFVSKDASLPYDYKEVALAFMLSEWFINPTWHRGFVSEKLY